MMWRRRWPAGIHSHPLVTLPCVVASLPTASPQAEFSSLDLKGSVKPGLERLCDTYRTRASELAQDLVSLREQAVARAERNAEKGEENQQLEMEVGYGGRAHRGWGLGGGMWACC